MSDDKLASLEHEHKLIAEENAAHAAELKATTNGEYLVILSFLSL